MLEGMLQTSYDGRAAGDIAKGNKMSSAKQGTDVDERLQRRQQQCSIEFTVLSLKVLVFDIATFVKFAKETTGNIKIICKCAKV
jgi:hypothetical protein